jgi:hypothetical protein
MQLFKHTNYYAAVLLASVIFAGCNKNSSAPKPIKATTTTTAVTTQTDDMVLTPAGLMPRSHTHFIQPGTELRINNGHIQQIESASGKMLHDFGLISVTTDPIHSNKESDALVVPAAVNGWAAYTYWSNPTKTKPITYFSTKWVVPAVPKTQGAQTVFLFNGMQDGETASSYIIQPVLQWGSSAAGGGKYWAVTNWFVSTAQTFYGTLQTVSAGTALQGVMTETGTTGSNYNYTSAFVGYPSAVNITVSNVPEAYWMAETLEVYSVTKAAQYPNQTSMPFSSIDMLEGTTNPTITWTAASGVTTALPKAVVNSNSSSAGEVTIDF